MTRRKPTRDKNGKFLPRSQTVKEKERPDTRASGGNVTPRPDAPRCEECGEELAEVRVIICGHVLLIKHCERCTPDPLAVLRGE